MKCTTCRHEHDNEPYKTCETCLHRSRQAYRRLAQQRRDAGLPVKERTPRAVEAIKAWRRKNRARVNEQSRIRRLFKKNPDYKFEYLVEQAVRLMMRNDG